MGRECGVRRPQQHHAAQRASARRRRDPLPAMRCLMLRVLLAAGALATFTAVAQAPAPDVSWPRQAKGADGTVVMLYQPQIETWADNKLTARAAVAVTRPGEAEPRYGVIELAARTQIDKASDVATLSELRITKSSF